MFGNNFLSVVKPAFDEWLTEAGYQLVHEMVSGSFDNGSLIYKSPVLRLSIVRDRGQILCDVRATVDWRDIDLQVLALLIAGAERFTKGTPVLGLSLKENATFLREHLRAVEGLFAPAALEGTVRRADALRRERAEALFGPWPGR